ncbi:MAG: IPT/TIG domain-containing protein, partial [Chloroflexota bacterium]|nr:IPT/TIG domain-containing protein [Chloroflexota bacterium]
MRKIVTAVSAAALSLSMLASAVPALAVTGYDSAYAGESAFVNISPGQTLNFQVFFANTGTTTWSRGTGTQVDLAACLDDKTTCSAQDAAEASWNSGWLSATRYASTVQTTTAPGALGTFSYNITAPVGATNGTYRFNGDLVLSSTGEKIHPEGYFQDATVGGGTGGAATITSIAPTNSGSTAGGDARQINGTGIVCTPAFPAVSFGGTNAVVNSCGATQVSITTPAHAAGTVTVTLTNSGSGASNGLNFTFNDTSAPHFTGMAVAGNVATVTFSEPVCRAIAGGGFAATDWAATTNSVANAVTGDTIPTCTAARDNGVSSASVVLTTTTPPGSFVELTLTATGGPKITDSAGNGAFAPE